MTTCPRIRGSRAGRRAPEPDEDRGMKDPDAPPDPHGIDGPDSPSKPPPIH
jgi:hypothetical protein